MREGRQTLFCFSAGQACSRPLHQNKVLNLNFRVYWRHRLEGHSTCCPGLRPLPRMVWDLESSLASSWHSQQLSTAPCLVCRTSLTLACSPPVSPSLQPALHCTTLVSVSRSVGTLALCSAVASTLPWGQDLSLLPALNWGYPQ